MKKAFPNNQKSLVVPIVHQHQHKRQYHHHQQQYLHQYHQSFLLTDFPKLDKTLRVNARSSAVKFEVQLHTVMP